MSNKLLPVTLFQVQGHIQRFMRTDFSEKPIRISPIYLFARFSSRIYLQETLWRNSENLHTRTSRTSTTTGYQCALESFHSFYLGPRGKFPPKWKLKSWKSSVRTITLCFTISYSNVRESKLRVEQRRGLQFYLRLATFRACAENIMPAMFCQMHRIPFMCHENNVLAIQ